MRVSVTTALYYRVSAKKQVAKARFIKSNCTLETGDLINLVQHLFQEVGGESDEPYSVVEVDTPDDDCRSNVY